MALLETLQNWISKAAVALITIFIGFIIAKLASRVAKKLMAEAELNRILKAAGLKPLSDTLGSILEYLIYTVTVLVVLQQFGLTKIVLGTITILAFVVIAFSLLLAVRDFIPNAVVGILMRKKMKKHLGKKVKIGAVEGRLEHFGLLTSIVKDKDEYHVPHLYSSKQKITRLQAN